MRDVDVLADLIRKLAADMRQEVEALSAAEVNGQPDPGGNSIGVTIWHVSRWLDVLLVQAFEGRPAEEEQWHTQGWATRTGYDPRGIGDDGVGAVTGYTQAEVVRITQLPAEAHLAYLDQACDALRKHILALPADGLVQPIRGFGGQGRVYDWLSGFLMGCFRHLGEIEALKHMQRRTAEHVRG